MVHAESAIEIKCDKQLFIDYRFIESNRNVSVRMNPPRKAGPILVPETPAEGHRIGGYGTVIEADGEFRYYYNAIPLNISGRDDEFFLCLAVSGDGVTWKRKTVGTYEFNGSKDNNIVMTGVATIFVDPTASRGYRFKALAQGDSATGGGMRTLQSKDGLTWELAAKDPVLPFNCDTQNLCFYDTRLKRYVSYVRSWHPTWMRSVSRCEVTDFYQPTWPHLPADPEAKRLWPGQLRLEMPIVLRPDEFDPPQTDLYTPSVVQYPWAKDVYLAFPSPYRHYEGFDSHGRDYRGKNPNDGPTAIQLAVSRDGLQWNRFREEYISPGLIGESDGGSMYMSVGMVRRGDEIYQYYSAYPFTHGDYKFSDSCTQSVLCRSIQRLDGFACVTAGPEGGEFTTPPIIFEGNRLTLNIDCGAMGEAWVEILAADGSAIEGYTLEDSVSVDRNATAQEVWWHNGPDVSKLAGKPVHLRFKLRAARLFAFQFSSIKK